MNLLGKKVTKYSEIVHSHIWKLQIVTRESVSYFLHLRWTDERLKWESNRLEVTVVDQKLIWLPYLRQFFAKDRDANFEGHSRQVKIFSNGTD